MRCPNRKPARRFRSRYGDVWYTEVAGTGPVGLVRVVCDCHPERGSRLFLLESLVEL